MRTGLVCRQTQLINESKMDTSENRTVIAASVGKCCFSLTADFYIIRRALKEERESMSLTVYRGGWAQNLFVEFQLPPTGHSDRHAYLTQSVTY